MRQISLHNRAVIMMVLSATIISTSGLFIRNLETATAWQVVFWRGLSLAVAILGFQAYTHRRATFTQFKRVGRLGVFGGLFLSGGLIGYVLAITNTTVANATFTMSAIPLFTAVLAWLVLGERVSLTTVAAIATAVGGIALMVGDGIATGTALGNFMALFTAVCLACFVVILRKGRAVDMLPATSIGATFSVIIAAYMMGGSPAPLLRDVALCLILGGLIAGSGHVLFVSASRALLGAELSLLALIEFILGPIWVWAFINETPSPMTLFGGSLVLAAVGGHAALSLLRPNEAAGADTQMHEAGLSIGPTINN